MQVESPQAQEGFLHVKHSYQWLCSIMYHQSKLARVALIHSGYKAHQRSSSGLLSSLFCQRQQ